MIKIKMIIKIIIKLLQSSKIKKIIFKKFLPIFINVN